MKYFRENYDIQSGHIIFPWKDQVDFVLLKLDENIKILYKICLYSLYSFR